MTNAHTYAPAIISSMERSAQQMPPSLKLAHERSLPVSTKEITSYIECLLDIEAECSLSPNEARQLTLEEQEACDRATD